MFTYMIFPKGVPADGKAEIARASMGMTNDEVMVLYDNGVPSEIETAASAATALRNLDIAPPDTIEAIAIALTEARNNPPPPLESQEIETLKAQIGVLQNSLARVAEASGIDPGAELYADMIESGVRTLDEVPFAARTAVQNTLNS